MLDQAFEEGVEMVDGLQVVRSSELEELSDDALTAEIARWAGRVAAGEARLLELIGEVDRRESWAGAGLLSCAHWLSWRLGLGLTAARERVRVARALRLLPLVAQVFRQGRLSWSQVRAMTRVATPEDQQQWLDIARSTSGAQIEKLTRGVRRARRLAEDEADPEAARHRLRVKTYYDEDGFLVLNVRLPADDGAVVTAALEEFRAQLDQEAQPDQEAAERPRPATQAQALVAALRTALQTLRDAHPSLRRRVKTGLTALVDPLSGWARLRDGELLPPQTAPRLEQPGDTAPPTVSSGDTVPLAWTRYDAGRTRRLASPGLRELLGSVDGERCRFPGCSHTRWLHAHHVQPWADEGPTDLSNLVLLCSRHHGLVHEQGFRLRLSDDRQLRVSTPDGVELPRLHPAPVTDPAHPAEQQPDDAVASFPEVVDPDRRLDLHYAVAVLVQQAA